MNRALGIDQTPITVDSAACERESEHQITARHSKSECPIQTPVQKFSVEVLVELDAEDSETAYEKVSEIMEAAWDRAHRDAHGTLVKVEPTRKWHYEMLEGCVSEVFEP